MTSVHIEGDKSYFSSKMAVDRFKRDLKNNDSEKLVKNDYFIPNHSYEILSQTDTEIKVKLVALDSATSNNVTSVSNSVNSKDALKQKLQSMKNSRTSQSNIKSTMKDKVPSEILDAYFELMKVDKLRASTHPKPDEVISNPEQYRPVIQKTVASFAALKINNPVTNYYRLLAKHLGINNTPTQPQQQNTQNKPNENAPNLPDMDSINRTTQDFINRLKNSNNGNLNNEMANIFKQLGIKSDGNSKDDVINDEMKNLFASLGLNNDDKPKEPVVPQEDDEMRKIYESLGITN